jgi:hypothetical protein
MELRKGESYSELDDMYSALTGSLEDTWDMWLKNIGGIYDTPKTYDMAGDQFEIVPKVIQKRSCYIFKHQPIPLNG